MIIDCSKNGFKNNKNKQITCELIDNHESDQKLPLLKTLLEVSDVIYKQLPKMTKEYIIRLVFDYNHKSIILRDTQSKKIIGCLVF